MPECKNDGILSLNVKKLLILHLVWKTNWILQYGSLFFIMPLILVRISRENLPKYGRTITKFFLGTVLTVESPLGPALANIFMCSFESKWLRDCPNDFKPVIYRRYIDDIFVLFSSPHHADKFREYLLSKHPNINFSIEKEEDGPLPFLDINIFHENDKFATNIYRKKTFSGVYTNFKSFIPETYKIGSIKLLLFRCFSLCSDFIKFHHEII